MAELSSVGQFPMTFLVIVYIFHEEKNGLKTFWKNPPTPEFCVQRNVIFFNAPAPKGLFRGQSKINTNKEISSYYQIREIPEHVKNISKYYCFFCLFSKNVMYGLKLSTEAIFMNQITKVLY